jgi:DNA-binding beta-propeller fold protein YncE
MIALAAAILATTFAAGPVEAKGSGCVLISNERADTVTVLDGASFEVVKTLSMSKRPQAMALSPGRTRIYVVAGRGDRLDIINIVKREDVRPVGIARLIGVGVEFTTWWIIRSGSCSGFVDTPPRRSVNVSRSMSRAC